MLSASREEHVIAMTERFGDLGLRLASGAVLGGLALGALAFGGLASTILIALLAGAMAWEWRSITLHGGGTCGRDAFGPVMACMAGVFVAHVEGVPTGGLFISCMSLAMTLMDRVRGHEAPGSGTPWGGLGVLFIGSAAVLFTGLRDFPVFGFENVLWVVLVVMGADIGGYFAGRLIGGPKLWPRVSPKKTWAGLAGGVFLAFLIGGVFSWGTQGTYFQEVCVVSALAALVAQGGDLAESAMKRRFGVKDSGTLIPGHGGVLDRLDGLMAATLVAGGATFWRGEAVFIW